MNVRTCLVLYWYCNYRIRLIKHKHNGNILTKLEISYSLKPHIRHKVGLQL
jgi:hypothetical protein